MNEKKYKQHMMIVVAIAVVLIGVSFYAGTKHGQKSGLASMRGQFPAGQMGGARAGARFASGGGVVMGSILSKDATSMTVQGRDGSSKIILYSGSTQIAKSAAGTADDVAVGTQVSVIGTQNPDGSVTAQSIQIRPADMQKMPQ
jgi:hypothetical protein